MILFLEDAGCDGPTLTGVVIIILLHVAIVHLVRSHDDLNKQLIILKYFCSKMSITINTGKTKVVIIKSIQITYDHFIYDNNYLEKVPSYKYLGIKIHRELN